MPISFNVSQLVVIARAVYVPGEVTYNVSVLNTVPEESIQEIVPASAEAYNTIVSPPSKSLVPL